MMKDQYVHEVPPEGEPQPVHNPVDYHPCAQCGENTFERWSNRCTKCHYEGGQEVDEEYEDE